MEGFFRFGSPVIELLIEGRKIETLLDTGFNGHIMIPYSIIDELGLDQIGISDYLTASGENKTTRVYKANALLLDNKIEVPILGTDVEFCLDGMEMFGDCRVIIDRKKGLVEVSKSS